MANFPPLPQSKGLVSNFLQIADYLEKKERTKKQDALNYISNVMQVSGPAAAFQTPEVQQKFTEAFGTSFPEFLINAIGSVEPQMSEESMLKAGYSPDQIQGLRGKMDFLKQQINAYTAPTLAQQQAGALQQTIQGGALQQADPQDILRGAGIVRESPLDIARASTASKLPEQIQAEAQAKRTGQLTAELFFADKKTEKELNKFAKKEAIKSGFRSQEDIANFERKNYSDVRNFFVTEYGMNPETANNVALGVVTGNAIPPRLLKDHPSKDLLELDIKQKRLDMEQQRLELEKRGALTREEKVFISGIRSAMKPQQAAQTVDIADRIKFVTDETINIQRNFNIANPVANKLVNLAFEGKEFPEKFFRSHPNKDAIKQYFNSLSESIIFAKVKQEKDKVLNSLQGQ